MDLRQANKEGWSIQMRGTTPEKIVWVPSYTPRGGPTTDHDASAFVRAKAEAGSAYHIEALQYLAFGEGQPSAGVHTDENNFCLGVSDPRNLQYLMT